MQDKFKVANLPQIDGCLRENDMLLVERDGKTYRLDALSVDGFKQFLNGLTYETLVFTCLSSDGTEYTVEKKICCHQ